MTERTETIAPTLPKPEPPRDPVDEASEESFPASDPPAWAPLHPGPPVEQPEDENEETRA